MLVTQETALITPPPQRGTPPPVEDLRYAAAQAVCGGIGTCRFHTENFFECVRSRKRPNLDAETGYMVMVAIRLGVDSYREGKTKLFDPKTEKVMEKAPPRPQYEGGRGELPYHVSEMRRQ